MTVTLGGRVFTLADFERITFAQAHYLMTHAGRVGIDQVWPGEGESDEAYEQRLRWSAVSAADIPALLAGYLLPDGQAWSSEVAEATRRHLEGITDPAEHATVLSLAARVAPDFFGRALALLGTSHLSSASATLDRPAQIAAH